MTMRRLHLKTVVLTVTTAVSLSNYISSGAYVLQYAQILQLFFKTGKNAWTSDVKWCNYVVCPADGGLLFNNLLVKPLLFSIMMFRIKFVKI